MIKVIKLTLIVCLSINISLSAQHKLSSRLFKLQNGVRKSDYLPNTLIVKFKNIALQGNKSQSVLSVNGVSPLSVTSQKPVLNANKTPLRTLADQSVIDKSGLNRVYEIKFSDAIDIEEAVNRVLKNPNVEYAEPSYIYHTFLDPNDPAYQNGSQEYLTNIAATLAWDVQSNANNNIIAIIDSGSDLQHQDLVSNIYLNTADPINGVDDDKDGYIDNYQGWDFVGTSASNLKEDNNPDATADSVDHGIHVSGLASAITNNGLGMASIAQNAKLMILKVGADDNARAIYRGYDGIIYAADHGAKIINCSWGGEGGGAFGQDVVNYAISKGCLIVAAAGNDGTNVKIYPAAFDGVFAVANVNLADVKAGSSSFGYHVDIASPGTGIFSTINNNKYGIKSGTSMAAPIVSSAAALVMAKFPTLTGLQVGEVLRLNTDNIYSLTENSAFNNQLGSGRLNVFKAVSNSLKPSIRRVVFTTSDKSGGSLAIGDTINYFIDVKNFLKAAPDLRVQLNTNDSRVKILTNEISVGAINTNETKKVGPFKVVILTGTPDNSTILFQNTYLSSAESYTANEFFESVVNLDYQNITVNKVYSTATSNGRIGYSGSGASNGLGFVYKDENLLYEAALMIGNSNTKVSNNARAGSGNTDNHFLKKNRLVRLNNPNAGFEGVSLTSDNGNSSPLNIDVKNRFLAYTTAPHDKYIIVEYEITNKNTSLLSNVYIGLFTDWDIDDSGKNITKYDAGLKLGYVYPTTGVSVYGGIKLLNSSSNEAFYPLSYEITADPLEDGNFTIAEKYTTLSSGIKATSLGSGTGNDVMFTIGNGPYSIPANGSVKVAFAFIGGDDLNDISASAVAAQQQYTQILTSLDKGQLADQFFVSQNFPNPSTGETKMKVNLPKAGKLSVEAYDIMGRKQSLVFSQRLSRGSHEIELNLGNLSNGIYFLRVDFEGLESVKKMIINR